MAAPPTIQLTTRFCGPPTSGNGGYVAGLLAMHCQADAVEVTLRSPPPLNQPLTVRQADADGSFGVELRHDETLIASAIPAKLAGLPAVPRVSVEDAERMTRHYVGHRQHPFPTCFVCGPERHPGDGLRIFPGREGEATTKPVAAPFVPPEDLCEADGTIAPAVIWAALDCPGYFGVARLGETALLGRITAAIARPVHRDESLVIVGVGLARNGRKLEAASALLSASGDVLACSRQTWIVPAAPSP